MDGYYLFVGLSVFIIGLIVGRLSMAVQYALMKPQKQKKQRSKSSLKYLPLQKKPLVKIGYSVNNKRKKQSVSGRELNKQEHW